MCVPRCPASRGEGPARTGVATVWHLWGVDAVDRYFQVVDRERPEIRPGNLRFYLDGVFEGIDVRGKRVLDVGAGDGLHALYLACRGAERVVALEPEAAGSRTGARQRFEQLAEQLGVSSVELCPETFQDYDALGERFDIVFLHSSINHLDEEACIELHRSAVARGRYRPLFAKLASLTAPSGRLIAIDCSRRNLFARLPLTNPVARTIEWEKHQPPQLWASLLEEAGFRDPVIRWTTFNSLRRPGRLLLGNAAAAWLLTSSFSLVMTKPGEGARFRPGASSSGTRAAPD
jgi:SAM-dependent methyltransferase